MNDKVTNMLIDLNASEKHQHVFKSMIFSKTANIKPNKEEGAIEVNYSCDKDICDFKEAIHAIKKNPNFLLTQKKEFCLQIIDIIKENQDDYLPEAVNGYIIRHMGFDLVHLKNNQSNENNCVTGILEYNNLREKSNEYYKTQQYLKAINMKTSAYSTCSLM